MQRFLWILEAEVADEPDDPRPTNDGVARSYATNVM